MGKSTCIICKGNVTGPGNNPQPLKDRGTCCKACNIGYVIPARLKEWDTSIFNSYIDYVSEELQKRTEREVKK